MKTASVLIFGLFISFFSMGQQIHIEGKTLSGNGNPVVFCTIIELDSQGHGTTSDEWGFFTFKNLSHSSQLQFSSIGYYDTIISVERLTQSTQVVVKLREKVRLLEEVVIMPNDDNEKSSFGIPEGVILMYNGKLSGISNLAGYASGVYISPDRKDKGVIQSVSIFLTDEGFPAAPFLLRILTSKIKMKDNKLENSTNFEDVLMRPVVIKPQGSGWCEVDLLAYTIQVPQQNFLVMLIPIDYGDKYSWDSANGKRYGGVVGVYEASSVSKMRWAIQANKKYGYVKAPGRDHVPAIVVKYLKE